MANVTIAEFARLLGINEGNVRKAIKAGRVILNDDGTIDSETQSKRWEATRDHSRVKKTNVIPLRPGRPVSQATKKAGADAADALDRSIDLKSEKMTLEISLLKEELLQVRKDTISRDEVRRGLAGFARLQRDKWINFPDRYGQMLAADIGADPKVVMAALSKYVRDQLIEISNVKDPIV